MTVGGLNQPLPQEKHLSGILTTRRVEINPVLTREEKYRVSWLLTRVYCVCSENLYFYGGHVSPLIQRCGRARGLLN